MDSMKCILIVTKVNFNCLHEFNHGEGDIFSGRAGMFNYFYQNKETQFNIQIGSCGFIPPFVNSTCHYESI